MNQPTLFPILPSEKPTRWPGLLACSIVAILLTMGFFAGRGYQHLKNGYNIEVRDEKTYPFEEGEIRWRYVTETIGPPVLMDSGKTVLEYRDSHGRETTLYKSRVGFQDGTDLAKNITTDRNTLRWDDGEFRYALKMEAMPKEAKPTTPTEPPADSPTEPTK